ncbi:MAG: hypothetical protein K2N30_03985 [Clostridia bacterium]|nr:hypothetical protein [Clostridia bacterium]
MFCPNCGKEISNDSSFCCFCGNALPAQNKFNNSVAPEGINPQMYAPVPAPRRKSNGCSIAGFVLSLISIVFTFFSSFSGLNYYNPYIFLDYFGGNVFFCFATAIIGLILSIVGTVKSKKIGKGAGLGIAGIAIGAISLVLWTAICFFLFILLISLSTW